jgi:hypothetical protein
MGGLSSRTVNVSKDTDISFRSCLAECGCKKGDLLKFLERAVRKEISRATVAVYP